MRFRIVVLVLAICFGGVAMAQPVVDLGTPDGVPPSIETVCDGQQGAAFGLCNAYCEAMDCDSPDVQASQQACDKVRDKFANITGEDLPCELNCPCLNAIDLWVKVAENPELITGCFGSPNNCNNGDSPPFHCLFLTITGESELLLTYDSQFTSPSIPENTCAAWFDSPRVLPISQEEALACEQVVRDLAASQGLACPADPR